MQFFVNGHKRHSDQHMTVAELVQQETGKAEAAGIAVAIGATVVPASEWNREIREGDEIDILIAVQGG